VERGLIGLKKKKVDKNKKFLKVCKEFDKYNKYQIF